MDRRLILAVAGSGKTTFLINYLNLNKRFLIVTYTNNNHDHIRRCIIDKFGYLPINITLLTYFQFLIRICYCPFLRDVYNSKGITWQHPDEWTRYKSDKNHYMTHNGYLYGNRLAKLCLEKSKDDIKERIEKYYDCFMFDEIQDLGGHDFNLIQNILPTKIDCFLVGDFYQHTFDTSNDGNVNTSLYKDYKKYKQKWSSIGVNIDETTLSNSYRCSQTICDFVTQKLLIKINSHREDSTNITFVNTEADADLLFNDNTKVKLFIKESHKYCCFAENWGKSKGLDSFNDICIVLNANTLKLYKKNLLHTLPASTLNKLYVACTRAKGNIYFIPHIYIDKLKK